MQRGFIILWLLALYLVDSGQGYAQTYRIWNQNEGLLSYFQFHKDHRISRYEPTVKLQTSQAFSPMTICSNNGTPLFTDYGAGAFGLNNSGEVNNATYLCPSIGSNVVLMTDTNTYTTFHTYDKPEDRQIQRYMASVYEAYNIRSDSFAVYQSGLYRSIIQPDHGVYTCTTKNELLVSGEDLRIIAVTRIRNFEYLMLISAHGSDYLVSYCNNQFRLLNRLAIDPLNVFKEPMNVSLPFRQFTVNRSNGATFSRDGKKLYIMANASLKHSLVPSVSEFEIWSGIVEYNLDAKTHQVLGYGSVLEEHQSRTHVMDGSEHKVSYYGTKFGSSAGSMLMAANDSTLYYLRVQNLYSNQQKKQTDWFICRRRRRQVRGNSEIIDTITNVNNSTKSRLLYGINLSPYGDLVSFQNTTSLSENNTIFTLYRNANGIPDIRASPTYSFPFDYKRNISSNPFYGVNPMIYDYIRLSYNVDYDCNARVQFNNETDQSLGKMKYTWYVQAPDGALITDSSDSPDFVFLKNGKYPFKLHAQAQEGHYSEWYFDTLLIEIPERPAVAFHISDSVVCAFQPVTFTNSSTSKQYKKENNPKLIWDFGDGETMEVGAFEGKNIIDHVYTNPGAYDVSLYFYNGYCDSTLVLTNRIRVVEAPRPGFTVDNNRGCSPFTVNLTDTVQLNVTRKAYFYSDVNSWQAISHEDFSHEFAQSGTYYIVQKLYGHTGCVTQTDTATIYVSKGLTATDSSYVRNVSYAHTFGDQTRYNRQIDLTWEENDAAVRYHIYKGSSPTVMRRIDSVTDGRYHDAIDGPSSVYYKVIAEDSCGQQGQAGNYAKPVLLNGTVSENNGYALLEFTKYRSQIDTEIEYEILQVGTHELTSIGWPNAADTSFHDKDFLLPDELEKCYLVSARNKNDVSYSNVLCLPYKPMVYIPSAVSPNNDGLNDAFAPILFGVETYDITIYDRWGGMVYQASDKEWIPDQNMKGKVFMYMLKLQTSEGRFIYRKGTVTVL